MKIEKNSRREKEKNHSLISSFQRLARVLLFFTHSARAHPPRRPCSASSSASTSSAFLSPDRLRTPAAVASSPSAGTVILESSRPLRSRSREGGGGA